MLTVILFLALLSLLVLVHEWGHYAAAKRAGMKVEEFGIGFPPRLFAKKGKDGMEWSVNAIPLGGFVRIKGENGEGRDEPDSFAKKGRLARFSVLIAGVAMNLVLAAVLFTVGYLFGLPAVIEGGAPENANISNRALHVVEVIADAPAAAAGLKVGDRIVSIDGAAYERGEEARTALSAGSSTDPVSLTISRSGELSTIEVTPAHLEELGREGLGLAIVETGTVRYPWYLAPIHGIVTTVQSTIAVVVAFAMLIAGLFGVGQSVAEVSGPVGIAVLTGEIAQLGFAHLIQFAAMLSVNLAVINVLPIPALDGGRILFLAVETIRRRPVSPKFESAVHAVGFALLMLAVVAVTYRDIANLF